jgi:hypothetical protein
MSTPAPPGVTVKPSILWESQSFATPLCHCTTAFLFFTVVIIIIVVFVLKILVRRKK